jgi:hypothetical protein
VAKLSIGTAAHDASISSLNISSVGDFLRYTTSFREPLPTSKSWGGGLNRVSTGDTQHYLEVASDILVVLWWCAIFLEVKWFIPIELMNGK